MLKLAGLGFEAAQAIATVVAMVFNFQLNNEITYRDQRLRGPRLWRGLLLFMLVCGFGAVANIGIAKTLYETHTALDHRRRDRCGDRRGVELRRLGDAGLARAVRFQEKRFTTETTKARRRTHPWRDPESNSRRIDLARAERSDSHRCHPCAENAGIPGLGSRVARVRDDATAGV